MKTLSYTFPDIRLDKNQIPDEQLFNALDNFVRSIETLRKTLVEAINFNSISFVSQASQPTPAAGEWILWKDSDAGSGQPTHYIVASDGTDTVTFASEELVP